jgi:ankyrin repeat protein
MLQVKMRGADVRTRLQEGRTMSGGDWKKLYQAVDAGDFALVQHYINDGLDPNFQHAEVLRTLLVTSLINGHSEIAHYLLAHGADPNLVSELDNLTPLQAAKLHGRDEFAKLLISLGAKEPRRPFWWRWLPV